jgi:tellurite resistance protein
MKLSAKDLEMVATTIVDAIYDDNYVSKAKQKMSEKMWKEFKNDKKVKELKKIFENPDIDSLYVKKSFFD